MRIRTFIIWLCIIILVAMGLLSSLLNELKYPSVDNFKLSTSGFLVSAFMLFEAKNALKPQKNGFGYNTLKRHFHYIGKPQIYKIIVIVIGSILFAIGLGGFFASLVEISRI